MTDELRKHQPVSALHAILRPCRNLSLIFLSLHLMSIGASFRAWAADNSAALSLNIYAGLSITGAVGTVYSIQALTDLSRTNEWRCLDFVRLPSSPYRWIDQAAPAGVRRFYRAVADIRTNFVFIPPGTFRMGSPTNEVDRDADEGPQTDVTLTHGFYMAKYKVTQRDYQRVTTAYPSVFTGDFDRPVETVSWEDATNYCAMLTRREQAAGLIPPNASYRLPTEAEWEYACRAWTSTRFSYGDDPGYTNLEKYAWFLDNSAHTTHVVGEKLPNPWGLYDMHGGLWEWCWDWYGPYRGGVAVDPTGPAAGWNHVFRGGSWGCQASRCRSAIRDADAENQTGYVGFRVVLSAAPPWAPSP